MYWLNGIASQLSLCNASKHVVQDGDTPWQPRSSIVVIKPSHHASLFVSCTRSAIQLWSVKPATILSFVERSEKHINEFGVNKDILWKHDASALVVITSKNYLLLYTILSNDQRSFEFEFSNAQHAYVTGPGEGRGFRTMVLKFRLAIRVDAGIACGTTSDDTLIIATLKPPAIQCISWNPQQVNETKNSLQSGIELLNGSEEVTDMVYDKAMNVSVWTTDQGRAYFVQNTHSERRSSCASFQSTSSPSNTTHSSTRPSFSDPIHWSGFLFYGQPESPVDPSQHATCVAVNAKFSLIAIGTKSGAVHLYSVQNYTSPPNWSHTLSLPLGASTSWSPLMSPEDYAVRSLAWTSDGYALAAGFEGRGLAVWSVYGSLLSATIDAEDMISSGQGLEHEHCVNRLGLLQDIYVRNVNTMFWGPGNHQLFILALEKSVSDEQPRDSAYLFTLPFAKSAITSLHNSDNARRGLLQMDDRLLLYNNGGDYQENNTSTIDPDAVAWTHIQYPAMYITEHWPIRYASINVDGKFIAVAGRRGLAHYNTMSSRWKLFGNQQQEQDFLVRGGLAWYNNILIAACEVLGPLPARSYEIRMYSRDTNLDNAYMLYAEALSHVPVYITICGSYLLVYTIENVLSIYYIDSNLSEAVSPHIPLTARLELVRRVSLAGIVARVARVRSISLFGRNNGDQMDSIEDVVAANLIVLLDGKLILLTPKTRDDDASSSGRSADTIPHSHYELFVLLDKIEYYWIGRKSIANMWTSLWAVDGSGVKLFANLLRGELDEFKAYGSDFESEPSSPASMRFSSARTTMGRAYSLGYGPEQTSPTASDDERTECMRWRISNLHLLAESTIYIPLDFYPLSILLEKGIVAGVEQYMAFKNALGLVLYKTSIKTHLFLHHILRYLLRSSLEEEAVLFARAYERLVYFSHALEILLHTVLEEEADQRLGKDATLPLVIKFLDQFPHALDVIVSCARKTEVALWEHLFSAVGKPKDLFELCLSENRLRTATSYLIILQTMQPLTMGGKDTTRLLQKAMAVDDYELCKELVRFLSSIDTTGKLLREALQVIKTQLNSDEPRALDDAKDSAVTEVIHSMQGLES